MHVIAVHESCVLLKLTDVQPIAKFSQEERHECKRHFVCYSVARKHGISHSFGAYCLHQLILLGTTAFRHCFERAGGLAAGVGEAGGRASFFRLGASIRHVPSHHGDKYCM